MGRKLLAKRAAVRRGLIWRCALASVPCVALGGAALPDSASAMTIHLTFDSTVTGLPNAAVAENATSVAASQISSLFSDNITININVVASTSSGFVGESTASSVGGFSFSQVKSDLITTQATTTDTLAYGNLPAGDPTGGGNFLLSTSQEKAMGLISGTAPGSDGTFTFSTVPNYTFDSANRAVAGERDFIGLAEHEITECMGRFSFLNPPTASAANDLFRYTAPGTLSLSGQHPGVYLSVDGGKTDLMDYNADPSGDPHDWASVSQDSFDAFAPPGMAEPMSPVDVAALDVIGFHAITPMIAIRTGTGTSWNAAGSWSPGSVPVAGEAAYLAFSDGVSRSIGYDYTGSAITLYSVTVDLTAGTGSATTTLSMGANNLSVNGYELVGDRGVGLFSQSGGTNSISGENGLSLGQIAGSNGTYSLSGTGVLSVTGSGTEFIGVNGTGTFTQSGGTNTVNEGTSTVNPAFVLGFQTGSSGNYSLSSTGSLSVTGNEAEVLGFNGAATFTQTGASNTSNGSMLIAFQSSSTATYSLSAGGITSNGSEYLGYLGSGTINQSGGTNAIAGANSLLIGMFQPGVGNYNLSGTGTISLGSSGVDQEYVGYQSNGTLTQTGGLNLISGGSALLVGGFAPAVGNYSLSGTGSLSVNGGEYIGYASTGTLTQTGGTNSVITGASIYIGAFSGGVGNYTLSGTASAAVSGGVYVGGTGSGAGGTGTLTVNSGQLAVSNVLQVWGGGKVNINGGTTTIGSLAIASGGIVNVNGVLLINYGAGSDPTSSIAALIKSGYNGGAWNGPGISSSSAAVTSGYGVGYADAADPGNPAGLSSGMMEVKYTLLGDANLDSVVNGVDFGILAANFNKGVTGWDKGDFNYDNAVNGVDFGFLAGNFNKGASGGSALSDPALVAFAEANGLMADVPEPATVSLASIAGIGLLRHRKRRRNLP
jgi:hypothetical protein